MPTGAKKRCNEETYVDESIPGQDAGWQYIKADSDYIEA
jgi:hypothetical protein